MEEKLNIKRMQSMQWSEFFITLVTKENWDISVSGLKKEKKKEALRTVGKHKEKSHFFLSWDFLIFKHFGLKKFSPSRQTGRQEPEQQLRWPNKKWNAATFTVHWELLRN